MSDAPPPQQYAPAAALDGTGQHAARRCPDLGVPATALAHGAGGRASRSSSCRYVGRSAKRKPRRCRPRHAHAPAAAALDGTGQHAARRCPDLGVPATALAHGAGGRATRSSSSCWYVGRAAAREGMRNVWREGCAEAASAEHSARRGVRAAPAHSARSSHARCGLRAVHENHSVSRRRAGAGAVCRRAGEKPLPVCAALPPPHCLSRAGCSPIHTDDT